MPTILACFVAGICIIGFITIWFTTAYQELHAKQLILYDVKKQMQMHQNLFSQSRDGPNEQAATSMLKTSQILYEEAKNSYNIIIKKTINRIPALIMGFKIK